jgi:hypothetical protein
VEAGSDHDPLKKSDAGLLRNTHKPARWSESLLK